MTTEMAAQTEAKPGADQAVDYAARFATVRAIDWPSIRASFVDAVERPSFKELEEQYKVPANRLMRTSSEEGWSAMRAAKLESRLHESDAASAILRAVKMDSSVIHAFTDVALETLAKLKACIDEIESKKSVTTRVNTLNTASFALSNLANAMAKVGIIGLPKSLKDAADNGNGKWSAQMLSSINLTVQNIVGQKAQASQEYPEVPETIIGISGMTGPGALAEPAPAQPERSVSGDTKPAESTRGSPLDQPMPASAAAPAPAQPAP